MVGGATSSVFSQDGSCSSSGATRPWIDRDQLLKCFQTGKQVSGKLIDWYDILLALKAQVPVSISKSSINGGISFQDLLPWSVKLSGAMLDPICGVGPERLKRTLC